MPPGNTHAFEGFRTGVLPLALKLLDVGGDRQRPHIDNPGDVRALAAGQASPRCLDVGLDLGAAPVLVADTRVENSRKRRAHHSGGSYQSWGRRGRLKHNLICGLCLGQSVF